MMKTLLVKDHPLMFGRRPINYYKKILSIPNVKLVDPRISSEMVLKNCDLVIMIRGAMGLEAVIKKIPVIALGKTMFQLLPKEMYRFCDSLYNLKSDVDDLTKNYTYNEEALLRYISSVIEGSCSVNLITDLLGKKGRYREETAKYEFDKHPHFDILTEHLLNRINADKS
tara:strand:- start:41 stop:550 length:510 start_codon:yes stop_codon:yes gene_type:complete